MESYGLTTVTTANYKTTTMLTLQEFKAQWEDESEHIEVHTSGSTGEPKQLFVEKSRMAASAKNTCRFLGLKEGNTALLCMPLEYIAGKMMAVRAFTWKLSLISVTPSSHPLSSLTSAPDFAAMTVMQVVCTLQNANEALMFSKIKNVIIGGGAIDRDLEEKLSQMPNRIWSSYGMTETLSHIALRRVSGNERSLWYTPMPNVKVCLTLSGCIQIDAPDVCKETIVTNDIGEMNGSNKFRIIGRTDNTINSGGIKIQAEEVELMIREALVAEKAGIINFNITSTTDKTLGEAVTLVYEKSTSSQTRGENVDYIKNVLESAAEHLPTYWKPRLWIGVSNLPLTGTGKPDRAALKRLVRNYGKQNL